MDDKTEVLEAVVKEAVDLVPKQSNPSLWFFFFFFFLKLCLRTILSVLSFAFWCICFLGLGFLVGLCGIFTLFGIFCCWVWDELYFKYGLFIYLWIELLLQENVPIEEVFLTLRCNKDGLTTVAAQERLAIFGYNKLEEKKVLLFVYIFFFYLFVYK